VILLRSAQETQHFGEAIGAALGIGDVVLLSGALGAGKTSLVRGMLHALGFEGEVPSPSYAIVIPYERPDVRIAVAHVDLYRIDDPEQLDELGLDDALSDGILLIEWPERAGDKRWRNALEISLKIGPDDSRRLTAVIPPSWEERWPLQ
jgi:tRNA threonylcarbamoyladenosine biosynthesis protein TsaE